MSLAADLLAAPLITWAHVLVMQALASSRQARIQTRQSIFDFIVYVHTASHPFGLREDVQENSINFFYNTIGPMEKQSNVGFLDPSKPTHSTVPFGKLFVTVDSMFVDSSLYEDSDVIQSSLEDHLIIWLL